MEEQLTLRPRELVKAEPEIECWDDDQDLQGLDDLHLLRNVSTTTVGSGTHGSGTSHHRDSISSRLSLRSDVESNGVGEEDWQLLIPTDDEASTNKAIASAKQAGVPIPSNVPASALLGGTIKRLGGRKLKKVLGDDYWMEDLEIPKPGEGTLRLKRKDAQEFPDTLRQISMAGMTPSSPKPHQPTQQPVQQHISFMERLQMSAKAPTNRVLDKYRESEDDGFADIPSISVAKGRTTVKLTDDICSPTKLSKKQQSIENLDDDFDFPADNQPLKLASSPNVRILPPKVDTNEVYSSFESAESGHGRYRKSPRSSSISALSPSVFSPSQSSLTAESEDDLDGLVLPDGPLKFKQTTRDRADTMDSDIQSPELPKSSVHAVLKHVEEESDRKEDFFQGIDIGDGDVFDAGKLTLNRNIKHKTVRQTSPIRRTAMTLTFTNKPQPGASTRIPKPQVHERQRFKLEPVSESGGPIPSYRRSQSRLGGHSTQSSISNIPTPSTPSFPPGPSAPSTPSRRGLNGRPSRETMRTDPTTTSAQLLKAQRSMPVIRNQPSPGRVHSGHNRPQSRSENNRSDSNNHRAPFSGRPKTPTERSETSLGMTRKTSVPFLPAGTTQSHHVTAKSSRTFHRPNSSDSNENAPLNRPISRLSNPNYRPNTPTGRRNVAPAHLVREAAMKTTLTKPNKRRVFGDGSELEVFDDLPTSASTESKFVKRPIAQGTIKASNLRNKLTTSSNPSTSSLTRYDSAPQTPLSPQKPDGVLNVNVPRFARGTTASQAREQRNAGTGNTAATAPAPLRAVESAASLSLLHLNRQPHLSAKSSASPLRPATHHQKPRTTAHGKDTVRKPQLITALGASDPKTMKGMSWNPTLLRWEGNENALATFDAYGPETSPPRSANGWASGTNTTSGTGGTCKPALIANVGGSVKGVQVVGGMVFDPAQMRWLRMAPSSTTAGSGKARQHSESSGNGAMTPETGDEEEDVFAGLEDLEDGLSSNRNRKKNKYSVDEASEGEEGEGAGKGLGLSGLGDDEWCVGEEFDVGPEFVRRQRAEEERWRRKVEGWVGGREVGRNEGEEWKWGIRGLVGR